MFYYFIIRDEFEFNDLDYCVLISVLNVNRDGSDIVIGLAMSQDWSQKGVTVASSSGWQQHHCRVGDIAGLEPKESDSGVIVG